MPRAAHASPWSSGLVHRAVLSWAARKTSATMEGKLFVFYCKLNFRPRKCPTPGLKLLLLHSCVSPTQGPAFQLLSYWVAQWHMDSLLERKKDLQEQECCPQIRGLFTRCAVCQYTHRTGVFYCIFAQVRVS